MLQKTLRLFPALVLQHREPGCRYSLFFAVQFSEAKKELKQATPSHGAGISQIKNKNVNLLHILLLP
jgi:hypothetical protein